MNEKLRSKLTAVLALLIILTVAMLARLVFVGGVEIRCGGASFSCHGPGRPILLLAVLILLMALLARRSPLRRLRQWLAGRRQTLILSSVVLLVAGIPRFWDLGGHSLYPDELIWMDRGRKMVDALRERQFRKATAHLGHPGVVPAALIGASFTHFGRSATPRAPAPVSPLVAARLPIALVGTATCLLLFLVGQRACGAATAFWAALFLALYPSHIALSRVAHVDSTLTLFFSLSVLCYLLAVREGSPGWNFFSAVCWGMALLTKSPALILPLILLVWKILMRLRERRGSVRLCALSDLAWLGAGLGTYFLLYTRLWCGTQETGWAPYLAGVPSVGVLAVAGDTLSSPLPVAAVWLVLAAGIGIIVLPVLRGEGSCAAVLKRRPLVKYILVTTACLAFIQIFHRPLMNELFHSSKAARIGTLGHVKWWMGRVVLQPPRWFYLFMLAVCMPPVTLACFIFGAFCSVRLILRREGDWGASMLWLMTVIVFTAVMSASNKMGFRYIDPVIPFVCLIAASGLEAILDSCARMRPSRAPGRILAAAVIVSAGVAALWNVHPEYALYYNALIGGPRGAAAITSVGYAEGTKQAVHYLKARVREEDSICTPGLIAEFNYHWNHDPPPPPCDVLLNRTVPPHVDWLVIAQRVRKTDFKARNAVHAVDGVAPAHSIAVGGVPLVDIYCFEDGPVGEGRRLEAGELRSDIGRLVPDAAAEAGESVMATQGRKGLLLYGPYLRVAPGRWRAVFRIKRGQVAGNAPVGRLAVVGISSKDVLCSREFGGGMPPRAAEYREIPVEFSADRPRRIQFCVESYGRADLWVDAIVLERRTD